MFFLSFSNANFCFNIEDLNWRSCTTTKVLSTTNIVEFINKRELGKAVLGENCEIFVIHVATSEAMPNHLSRASLVQDEPTLAALKWDKTSTKIPAKYADYVNVFSSNRAMKLPKNISIYKPTIKLVKAKQLFFCPLYAFILIELETLKTHIKTHLKTGFIRTFRSSASTLILFDKKSDGSLCLYIDYRGLNHLTIKNRYFMSLIYELLD